MEGTCGLMIMIILLYYRYTHNFPYIWTASRAAGKAAARRPAAPCSAERDVVAHHVLRRPSHSPRPRRPTHSPRSPGSSKSARMLLLLPLILPGDSSALATNTASVQNGASKMLLPVSRLSAGPMVVSPQVKLMRFLPKQHMVHSLRGGAISSSLADYSSAASDLFG
eukprot:6205734-Pleurochrysis_carterae.AAC.4